MHETVRLLRQIRLLVVGAVAGVGILLAMVVFPELQQWVVGHRGAVLLAVAGMGLLAGVIGVPVVVFQSLTRPAPVGEERSSGT